LSNNFGQNGGANDDNGKDCNYLGSGDYSPEKAGVGFNSVPGHHYFQSFSKSARNFTPVISYLWSLTVFSKRLSNWLANFRIADQNEAAGAADAAREIIRHV
jgi:hypothetical protein